MTSDTSTLVERIEVSTPQGISLSAVLTKKSTAPADQVLVLCHGFLNHSNSTIIRGLTNQLPFNVCAIDFRGNGFSKGTTRYGNYLEEVEDLKYLVEHLREELHLNVLGILGHSKGASVVLLYASSHHEVPLIINVAGRYDMSELPMHRFTPGQRKELEERGSFVWRKYLHNTEEKDFVVSQEDLTKKKNTDMSVVRNIDRERVRVLSVHGEDDTTIPVQEVHMYDEVLGPKPYHEVAVIKGATHFFRAPEEQQQLGKVVNDWIEQNIDWAKSQLTH
ncbi:alpha/beta-hydrolase [Basidiobolus meristosporus CBS 931.73]|uniref:Alpha/beta-hydrolase n=1 Tax=Basidiobolus meristosporus CBS 931.73 TaxID=1314790 RepID=A0A1Y1YDC5_9FUNG|nr:alpha/beta-hydrolase [Basidiobolus meristosporus CBS 931.73]|eukprot:ORX95987.1 alpha/beta-hydrolase [Basidiobolus meristosporus CBS 931.73]